MTALEILCRSLPAAHRLRTLAGCMAATAGIALCGLAAAAPPTTTYDLKATFDVSTGYFPSRGLAVGADGRIYGLTSFGGANFDGTIFRAEPGGGVTVMHSFNANEGGVFSAPVLMPDGTMWAVGQTGGPGSEGTLIRFVPSTGAVTVVHEFGAPQGAHPNGRLLLASDGWVYGTTLAGGPHAGGSDDGGTIFRIDPTTLAFESVHAFSLHGPVGGNPGVGLTQSTDGRLYSWTAWGGTAGFGSIFSYDPGSGRTYLVHPFPTSGARLEADLTLGPGGVLYGAAGGDASGNDPGAVVSVRPNGNFTIVHAFEDGPGVYPSGGLMLDTDGYLYGNTSQRTRTGNGAAHGTAYRVQPDGKHYAVLHLYDDTTPRFTFLQVGNVLWDVSLPYGLFTLTLAE